MRFTKNSTKWMLILGLPALLVLASGCGLDRSPVSQEEETLAPAAEGRVLLAFSPEATLRAAKSVKGRNAQLIQARSAVELVSYKTNQAGYYETDTGRHLEGRIDNLGGGLRMVEAGGNPKNDLIVEFVVPEGGLDTYHQIAMTVYGDVLSELVVAFEPAGLTFLQDARLDLRVGMNRVDLPAQELTIWHVHDDGTVEEAVVSGIWEQGSITLVIGIDIPGFSRYAPYNSR